MKLIGKQIRLSATDLSSHLACRYVTTLDLGVARKERTAPEWRAPDLAVIQELGERHEAAYLDFLRQRRNTVLDLRAIGSEEKAVAATLESMQRGVEIIAQGALASGRWFGRTDVLQKVPKPSRFGEWSYEVYDCKLARETKATTILQLALYAALLSETQQSDSEFMHVVPPGRAFEPESYRVSEYAAYYRYVRARLEKACEDGHAELYPEPCTHCDICRWFAECNARRRADDHLSLVAGIRRQQRVQLEEWKTETMAALAALPIPLKDKPRFGSRASMERVREQARIQVQGREAQQCLHETLPAVSGAGFALLPEPDDADMFVDLEGDPFAGDLEAGGGQQYLFGFVAKDREGKLRYEQRWALDKIEEKRGFEWLVDEVMTRWGKNPGMHLYHFGHYEKDHLKKLAGRYVTREDEIDRMLRAHRMVDLHSVMKQAVRASVEEYSLKALEKLYAFERKTSLEESRAAMRYVEHRLELGWEEALPDRFRAALEGYNADDCFSTAAMRDWLEVERSKSIAAGAAIERPPAEAGEPPEKLDERQKRIAALFAALLSGIPLNPAERTAEQQATWTLANLLDWHRRENKAGYWEGYRLEELDEEALRDERAGLVGLKFEKRLRMEGQLAVDRYSFDRQETEVRRDDCLFIAGTREKFGEVVAIDAVQLTMDVKKTRKTAPVHPCSVYAWDSPYKTDVQADALFQLGEWVRDHGVDSAGPHRAARDLLLRKSPRLRGGETLAALPLEEVKETACRIAGVLRDSVFAIQGPPGAGKTFTGARMICRLVQAGKKVGITAHSHKVIRKLLTEVVDAAKQEGIEGVRCMHKGDATQEGEGEPEIAIAKSNEAALQALASGKANVLGGTSWLWSRSEACGAVNAIFVDEAGQMALADVLAVAQSATNLFLIGDPQQLQRPQKGSHPQGAEKSALEYLIGEHKTIPPEMGMLLPQTWRMHPEVCRYTSEMFYDGKLGSRDVTTPRVLQGHAWLTKPGLYFVPVKHEGNRNSSAEEVDAVAKIVAGVLRPEVVWFRSTGNSRRLGLKDIVIVAPYNAQVADIQARIPGAFAGTVDRFQGQEAAVVIYSLTTSSPEDVPHGMEFLYSLNRLNVATSRAMCNVILVASPRLLEPECKNPRQMQLANALCRYKELAIEIRKV